MESRAKLFGHSIHQMLIVFPLGLLGMSAIFDCIALITQNIHWPGVAYYMIGAGVLSGLVAAIFGTIDFLSIPKNTRARRVGFVHGVGNVIVVTLFAASWMLRRDNPGIADAPALTCSFLGFGLALITGWLGGELVSRLGVGVDDGANVNAPSSFSDYSADEHKRRANAY